MTLRQRFLAIPFAVRLAVTCWVILTLGVCGRVAFSKPGSQSVVPIYLTAAERWLAGDDLYEPVAGLDVYRNPPGFAAAWTPFTLLPPRTAGVLWRLLSIAVLLAGTLSLAKAAVLTRSQTGAFAAIVALLTVPSVNNGQVNALLIGSVLLGVAAVPRERKWQAAFWLALAASLKLYPLAAAMLVLLARPSLAGRFALLMVALLAAPFALQSPDYVLGEYRRLFAVLGHDDRTGSAHLFRVPQDWTYLPRVWLGLVVPAAAARLVSFIAGAIMAVAVMTARPADSPRFAFVLGSIWMTLFGPATEIPTYTLLAPAAAWMAVTRPSPRTVLPVALLALPILRAMFPMTDVLPLRSALPLAGLLMLVNVVRSSTLTVAPPIQILVSPTRKRGWPVNDRAPSLTRRAYKTITAAETKRKE